MGIFKKGATVAILLVLGHTTYALAQERYPEKRVEIILPHAAGGSNDIINRVLSEKLRGDTGQPFLVINKPGASGVIAANTVATSKADGYTIYGSAGASTGYLHLINLNFNRSFRDFAPVAAFGSFPQIIIVSKNLPVKSLPELAAYIRNNPGVLSYGGVGYGTSDHLAFEMFKSAANIPTEDVPLISYNGAAPTLTAVAGNQVPIGCLAYSAIIRKQIEAGNVRAVAVLSPKRYKFLPDVPTAVEEGYPELVVVNYFSHWVPAKTPAATIKQLEAAIKKATEDSQVREKIERMDVAAEFLNSQDLLKYTDDQVAKFESVIKKLNITAK
jgi:tripartite-type tricarboxylate transporter receptor subunit TctC